MNILFVVNYYFPYVSGLSEYVRTVAEEMVKQGHVCTVVCSNHGMLQPEEYINGVKVIRTPVIMKISKGTVSPKFIFTSVKLSKKYDVVNLHIPMLEAGILSLLINRNKIVSMYHCDVNLPRSIFNDFIVKVMDVSHEIALKRSRAIIVSTYDYAKNSRIAKKYIGKMSEAFCPIKEDIVRKAQRIRQVNKNRNHDNIIIGFCGRIVEEKGIGILIESFEKLKAKYSNICLKVVGEYKAVAGGSVYEEVCEYIRDRKIKDIEFLGGLTPNEVADFYGQIDVLVLPSINTLEAFGTVQVEAMICGVPVVVSDLPGVRTVPPKTGMGLVCTRNDVDSLTECIEEVVKNREHYINTFEAVEEIYGNRAVVNVFRKCFGVEASGEK